MKNRSSLAEVVYKRTYARTKGDYLENWPDTVERVIRGNISGHSVSSAEAARLEFFMLHHKAMPAGRGLWFSGTPAHSKLGGAALNNCWFLKGDDWRNLVLAQDLLMLGGGVGFSIESRFVSRVPTVRNSVRVVHTTDDRADIVVPDSREGWCEMTSKLLESYFESGKSFSYSTNQLRPRGQSIQGFGGVASGPEPLIRCMEKIAAILETRNGLFLRPIDMMDLLCSIGDMVVSGNVRRSAILILGDADDRDYLQAKRWDQGPIPPERAMANLSIVANSYDELSPLFWETYTHGEPFGIVNRHNLQKYGRMGEESPDEAIGVNPCAEATLCHGEPCNLQEIFLPHIQDEAELTEAAKLMHRWGKRVTCENYHIKDSQEIIRKNRRVGTSITGCLESSLFKSDVLDRTYEAIQQENRDYSKTLGIPMSIRTTLIKPSGTLSLMEDCLPGIHPAYAPFYIRRVRFSANMPMIRLLAEAGHPIEPALRLDGSTDPTTVVVSFFVRTPSAATVWGEKFGLLDQLRTVLMAQRHWSDQSVSVTVYYKRDEIPIIQDWLKKNLSQVKTISFLSHSDHGFLQAPMEQISETDFNLATSKLKTLDLSQLGPMPNGSDLDLSDCEGTGCPVK